MLWLGTERSTARLEQVAGGVLVDGAPAQDGQSIVAGMTVVGPAGGNCTIRLPDGSELALTKDFSLTVNKLGSGGRFTCHGGRVSADVGLQSRDLAIATPHATATVLGTSFDVTVDSGKTLLAVTHGEVRFANRHAALVVATGQSSMALADRAPERLYAHYDFDDEPAGLPPEGWTLQPRRLAPKVVEAHGRRCLRFDDKDGHFEVDATVPSPHDSFELAFRFYTEVPDRWRLCLLGSSRSQAGRGQYKLALDDGRMWWVKHPAGVDNRYWTFSDGGDPPKRGRDQRQPDGRPAPDLRPGGQWIRVRVRVVAEPGATTLSVRWWDDDAAEPANWLSTCVDRGEIEGPPLVIDRIGFHAGRHALWLDDLIITAGDLP